jgi:acetoin utilization protein AcuB
VEDLMLRVQDLMTQPVETVRAGTPADEAWARMHAKGIHHLVVITAAGVVGVISDRDAGGRRGSALRRGRTVADLMSRSPVCVTPDTPVRKAANVLRGRSIGSLVVTDDRGRLVGIVTAADLLELLGRGIERPVLERRRWTLKHRVPHRKRHQAAGAW